MTQAQAEYEAQRIETFVEVVADRLELDSKLLAYERALLATLDRHEQATGPMAPSGHGWITKAVDCIATAITENEPGIDPYTKVPTPDELRRIVSHEVERGHITGKAWTVSGSSLDWTDLRITASGSDLVRAGFADPVEGPQINVAVKGDLALATAPNGTAHIGDNVKITFTPTEATETLIAILLRLADLLDNARASAEARDIAQDPDPASLRARALSWLGSLTSNAAASGLVQAAIEIARAAV